jgi:hypothetical protein
LKDWIVIDRGVNGQPFLWKKRSGDKFVMIDIFNPNPTKRCYSVFVLRSHPDLPEAKKKAIGVGCAGEDGWHRAYERARRIAEEFMTRP